jgi:hypothetical protein
MTGNSKKMAMQTASALRWFKRVLWIGIAANVALAVPTLVATERLIAFAGLPPATPLVWPRFAAWLLLLLSVFYMPAGIDPVRYRATAWSAVGARLAGVVFFLGFQAAVYRPMGYFDLVFLVPEAILLARGLPPRVASAPTSQRSLA